MGLESGSMDTIPVMVLPRKLAFVRVAQLDRAAAF